MKHFSTDEWKLFFARQIETEQEMKMEGHLLDCEECQQRLLHAIGSDELEQAALLIPTDFTSRVLEQTAREVSRPKPEKRKPNQGRILFKYYAASAAVTILVTGGGMLHDINIRVASWPEMYSPPTEQYTHILFDWPSQLRDKTAGLLSIEIPEFEREVK